MTVVPLSARFQSTGWPIAAFNVVSKPCSARCNLRCDYCFYRHNQSSHDPSEAEVSPLACGPDQYSSEMLETFISDYIASQENASVLFTWQGGEPTLAGLDFYRQVAQLQAKHERRGVKIVNALQTNGRLLDEQWCRFLAENQWVVGISVDGPAEIHDTYRRTAAGSGSFASVCRAVDLLHRHAIAFNTLTVVSRANAGRGQEVYEFLSRELGSSMVQLLPCAERKDFRTVAPWLWSTESILPVGDARLNPKHPESIMTEWSIAADDWGNFLSDVFDAWWPDREKVIVNWFHSWGSQFAGGPSMMCVTSPVCGRGVALETDGSVYSCDHFVFNEYRLGTAGNQLGELSESVRTDRQKRFGEAKTSALPGYCRRCPFLFACNGECPKHRFVKTPEGEPGLNYFCAAYRTFLNHAGGKLAEYGHAMKDAITPIRT